MNESLKWKIATALETIAAALAVAGEIAAAIAAAIAGLGASGAMAAFEVVKRQKMLQRANGRDESQL